jgi:hypothetical protein
MGRGPLSGIVRTLTLALAFALASAAAASADMFTMGPTDIDSGPLFSSTGSYTYVQAEDHTHYVLIAPADGVVSTWRVNMKGPGNVTLLALQPQENGTYTTVASTPAMPGSKGKNEFHAPLQISKGEAIGLQVDFKARVWARAEAGGVLRERNDRRGGAFLDVSGYYLLFQAEVQYSSGQLPPPPQGFPPDGVPPPPPGDFPPSLSGLPQFPPSSGGSSGSSGSQPAPASAPSVNGLSPASGSAAGGEAVVISGSDFAGASAVYFDGSPAQRFTVDGYRQITAITPAHSEGNVEVHVVTDAGTSPATAADIFRFVAQAQTPPATAPVQAAAQSSRRVRCAHAPTLIGRSVSAARGILRAAGCGSNLRIVLVGKRQGHRRVTVRSQVPAPRHTMRRDRRVLIRVR